MIVKLLCLKCDFCTAQVTDEFDNEDDARSLMAEHGWTQEKVENGALWDKCPKCNGIESGTESVGQINKFGQKVLSPMANSNKVWLECGGCGRVYLCDSEKVRSTECPRCPRSPNSGD